MPPILGPTTPFRWRAVVLRFLLTWVPLLVVSGAIVGGLYWNRHHNHELLLEENEREHIKLLSEIITADFRSVMSDLMTLADARALKVLLHTAADADRRWLAQDFQLFLERKQLYDQLRYLDTTGKEVVRINLRDRHAEIVPDDQLQQKHDRYYFEQALGLARGEVFVSPLDLNVEEGKVERPPKPTIRFATPVFDEAQQLRGIVVLNYLGEKLLDKLRRQSERAVVKPQLLNAEGYWLAGPNPADEWGFMFPDRIDRSLAHDAPGEWQQIQETETGQFRTPSGLYTFRTVFPLRTLVGAAGEAGIPARLQAEYQWKLLSHISRGELAAASQEFWTIPRYVGIALAVVLGIVSWLFARLSVEHQRAREQLLHRERLAAIGEAMTALAHESRNALQRSQSALEMLKKRVAGNPDAAELVGEVQEAQVYLTDLYEEARGFAAPVNLRREPADLRQLLHKTWEQLIGQRRNCNARLMEGGAGSVGNSLRELPSDSRSESATIESATMTPVDTPPVDTRCEVDLRAIGQVFRNVLENALASADSAEVEIRWSEARLGGRPALRLIVRDNGPGVPRDERQRIFEPFYTTKVRGTGLGLAISRRVVAAHGGEIVVADTDGPGAEFWITLPRRE
jgi:signal transduction histidine kinase